MWCSRLTLLALVLAPATAHAERLTVTEVVRIAVANHPRVDAARATARAAHADARSAGGRLLPSIGLHEDYQHFDRPFDVGFGAGPAIRARSQDTSTFVAGASQPLVGLLQRSQVYAAQGSRAEAADASVEVVEADLQEALETAYLDMFESRAMEEIARASQGELQSQVAVTVAGVHAGSLTNADLLRVKVAEANARQQGIAAHARFVVARARVLSAIGRSPTDATVEFAEPTTLLATEARPSASTTSPDERAEVIQARHLAEAARHQERSRFYALFPEVDAEAAYVRVDGQVFAPANSLYVGLKANWPIWEWGTSFNARRAAAEQAVAARSELEARRREALVDVTTRRAELEAAVSVVDVAEQTIASAEEAFRVMTALVAAGSATVTDLLDAQSALTQARLNLTRARYEQAIARVQVRRASAP